MLDKVLDKSNNKSEWKELHDNHGKIAWVARNSNPRLGDKELQENEILGLFEEIRDMVNSFSKEAMADK